MLCPPHLLFGEYGALELRSVRDLQGLGTLDQTHEFLRAFICGS